MATADVQDTLRKIKIVAENIASIASQPASSNTFIASSIPNLNPSSSDFETDLNFPQPMSLATTLVDEGIPTEAAERLSHLFIKITTELQRHLNASFCDTWSKVSQIPRHPSMLTKGDLYKQLTTTFRAVYDQRVTVWTAKIQQLARSRTQTIRTRADTRYERSQSPVVQKVFNHNYVPVLESFFAKEQFPSRADKMFLAEKAEMTYRQIHVWFQNRRTRSRKDPSYAGNSGRFDSSEDTDVEDTPMKSDFSSRASSFTLVADDHPFESKSPPHAFPRKYPPDFDEKTDPFPCRFGDFSSFPKANWDRKCSVLPLGKDDAAVDVDALSESFGKLCIRSMPNSERVEVDYPCIWGSYNPRPLSGCDVMAAYTTRPFSAPIPSFIRYPHQERDLRPCTIFRPQHRDLLQTKSNVSSLLSHDTPSSKSAPKTKRANKPRLPKRVPTNQPKLSAMSKSMLDPLGLANTDEAHTRSRGRTLTPPLGPVALLTRSASSSSDESLPSLTHSVSSSSSSEAQSPSSPAQGLPDESTLCFMPEFSAISKPDTSQGLLADIPFSLFASSDFNYDLISSKPFVDTAYDLAFSQSQVDPFLSLQLQPPPAIPQSLPFSFDFAPLTS